MSRKRYWKPIKQNVDYISSLIKDGAKVLEIGPGHLPFSKATEFCGWTDEEQTRLGKYKIADASAEMLPYKNKEFDFVYCRHVIEDLWNPINALKEISRISKEGYIETPSPLCELSKDVDGALDAPWRGYAHHRYIVWNDSNVLNILPKFPIVEYINLEGEKMDQTLTHPFAWCTFFHFKNEIQYKLHEMGRERDFSFLDDSYTKVITNAIKAGLKNSNQQLERIKQYYEQKHND